MRIAWSLLVLLLLACARPPAAPSRAVARAHPADDIRGARLLPATALAFVTTGDFGKLVDELGRRELRDRFADEWERVSYELVGETGWDLTSPELLADLGVDVGGEAGAALLPSEHGPALAIYFGLSKPAVFKNALYRALDGRARYRPEVIRPSQARASRIVVGGGDAAAVLAGDMAWLVFAHDARPLARELAAIDTESSLSRLRAFRIAMRATPRYSQLRGYLDLRGLAYLAAGVDPPVGGHDRREVLANIERQAQRALSRAREHGAGVDDLVAIDDHYARMRKRVGDAESPVRALLGGIDGAGLAVSVHSDGLDLTLSVDAPASPLRELLRDSDAGRRFAALLERPVLGLATLSFDGPELVKALRLGGVDDAQLLETLGIDLGADVAGLAGALSVGVLLPDGGLTAITDPSDLALVAHAPLRDPAAAKAWLVRLANSPGLGKVELVDGDVVIHDADIGPLRIGVRGHQLLVAPDADTLDALAKRSAERPHKASTAMRMAERSAGLSVLLHLAAVVLPEIRLPSAAPEASVDPPWHDPEVPKSAAYADKLAELRAIDAELRALTSGGEQARFRRIAVALAPLGSAAVTLSPSDHGMRLDATYRTRKGSMASVGAGLVEAMRGLSEEAGSDHAKLGVLFARRAELESELEQIYLEDKKRR